MRPAEIVFDPPLTLAPGASITYWFGPEGTADEATLSVRIERPGGWPRFLIVAPNPDGTYTLAPPPGDGAVST